MHTFARLFAFTGMLVAAVIVALTSSRVSGTDSWAPVAYQGTITTTTSISNAPTFQHGSCVPVRVTVTSDSGIPRGTVEFLVDGVVYDRHALPSSGAITEMIGCCGSRFGTPLSVGTHHFEAVFIPQGNWGASRGTGTVVITPAKGGAKTSPACGGTSESGLPTGVNAGLDSITNQTASSGSYLWRGLVSGGAILLAAIVVAAYRRRDTFARRRGIARNRRDSKV